MANVTLIEEEILQAIRPNLSELCDIWEYVGYTGDERSIHLQQIAGKFKHLFEDIVLHENTFRIDLEHRIELRRREVADLCIQLRISPFLPDRGLSANELMKVLDQKCDELKATRQHRCDEYTRLRSRILLLSQRLNEPAESGLARVASFPPLDPHSPGTGPINGLTQTTDGTCPSPTSTRIPEERELKRLTEILEELNVIYTPLITRYNALCDDIARIATEVCYGPQSDRESELFGSIGLSRLCGQAPVTGTPGVVREISDPAIKGTHDHKLATSDDCDDLPAVNEETLTWLGELRLKLVKEKARLVGTCEELRAYLGSMWCRLDKPKDEQERFLAQHGGYQPETLEALQEEVDRCQQMKWEKLDTYVTRLTNEAIRLANICCMDESVIRMPSGFDSTDPEIVANHLETVLEQLNRTFESHKPIFERIAAYEEQWQALLDVELRLKDPSIFANRGGILLKTEKEKKRLSREVQRAEQDVLSAIEQHEMKTKSPFVLPSGRTFKDYLADRSCDSRPSRDPSRARRSVVSSCTNSRPNSTNFATPPGAPS